MKRTIGIGIFFFLVILGNIRGQGWFLDSTYVWTEFNFGGFPGSGETKRYTFSSSSTEMNGKQYYERLSSSTPSGDNWGHTQMFYRTDEPGKVYLSYFGYEQLIYDYTLNVNDTFFDFNGADKIVDQIDSIQLENGEHRKRMAMRCSLEDYIGDYWIEGLGGIGGVYDAYPEACVIDGDAVSTLCISRNNTLLFDHPDFDSCWLAPVATLDLKNFPISIYPNPASSEIFISSKDHQVQQVSAVDLLGKTTFIGNFSPFDIYTLPPGYYFLRIELEDKQMIMKPFVKQ